jgi:rhodanese-related sulfurtransferase
MRATAVSEAIPCHSGLIDAVCARGYAEEKQGERMRLRFQMQPVALLAAVLLAPQLVAAQPATIQSATLGQTQKAAEISTEELRRILADGSATVFDARPFMEFAVGHIPGAVNVSAKRGVPMSLYVSDVAEIERLMRGDKSAPIVLYCNGPFCGKSSRLAEELLQAGFANVRRYQLGAPVWRALGGVMQLEPEGFVYVRQGDRTARIYDTRSSSDYAAGTLPDAIHLPKADVEKAKDDGRLPMEDHNTRIIVFGASAAEARATAEAIARNAFHNAMFCADAFCRQQIASR